MPLIISVRIYLLGLTPSSPNIALFKNGELGAHPPPQRYQIEGKSAKDKSRRNWQKHMIRFVIKIIFGGRD